MDTPSHSHGSNNVYGNKYSEDYHNGGQGGLIENQLPAAGTSFDVHTSMTTDQAARVVRTRSSQRFLEHIVSKIGLVMSLSTSDGSRNLNTIVADIISKEAKSAIGTELGECCFSTQEMMAELCVEKKICDGFLTTTKAIRRDPALLQSETDSAQIRINTQILEIMLKAYLRSGNMRYNYLQRASKESDMKQLRFQSIGCVNRGTGYAQAVMGRAMQLIEEHGYRVDRGIGTGGVVRLVKDGTKMALSVEFVGQNASLAVQTPSIQQESFKGVPLIPITERENPLIQPVVIGEFNQNTRDGTGDRTMKIFDMVTGNMVEPDWAKAIRSSNIFGHDGKPIDALYEMCEKYNRDGTTNFHETYLKEGDNDPYKDEMGNKIRPGPAIVVNRSNEWQVSRILADLEVGDLDAYSSSVLRHLGPNAAEVMRDISELENELNTMHNSVADPAYWIVIARANADNLVRANVDETGQIGDARGNAFGGLDYPYDELQQPTLTTVPATTGSNATTAVTVTNVNRGNYAGFGSPVGIATLAALATRQPQDPLLQRLAKYYRSAQVLGDAIKVVTGSSYLFTAPPSWFHAPVWTSAMAVISSLVNGLPVFFTNITTGERVLNLTTAQVDSANTAPSDILDNVAAAIAAPRVDTATATAAQIQEGLVAVANGNDIDLRDRAIDLLEKVAGIIAGNSALAGIASLSFRAAAVFAERNIGNGTDADLDAAFLTFVRNVLGEIDASAQAQRHTRHGLEGAIQVVETIAALVQLQGTAWLEQALLSEDPVAFYNKSRKIPTPSQRMLSGVVIPTSIGGGARDGVRSPLIVSGISATTASSYTGNVAVANPVAPWNALGAGLPAPSTASPTPVGPLFRGLNIGAPLGGGASSSSEPAVPESIDFVKLVANDTAAANFTAAQELPTAHRIVAKAMLLTPFTSKALTDLLKKKVDFPFAHFALRYGRYTEGSSMIILDGSPEHAVLNHELVEVIPNTECNGKIEIGLSMEACASVTAPAASVVLPFVHIQGYQKRTFDTTIKTGERPGAIIYTLMGVNSHADAPFHPSGLDSEGNLVYPFAAVLHETQNSQSFFNPEEYVDSEYLAYQGRQDNSYTNTYTNQGHWGAVFPGSETRDARLGAYYNSNGHK